VNYIYDFKASSAECERCGCIMMRAPPPRWCSVCWPKVRDEITRADREPWLPGQERPQGVQQQ